MNGWLPSRGVAFGVLGPLLVWRDGRAIDGGTPQQREMLALLLIERRQRIPADTLIDALWAENPPPTALQTVRTYASRLRRLVADDRGSALETERGGYRLVVPEDRVDLDRFLSDGAAARRALLAGDPERAERHLRRAIDLWRGPPFSGLRANEAVSREAERLRELELLVQDDLTEALLAQGRQMEVIGPLRAALADDPYRERAWGQLMLALYRSGGQREALDAYREARRRLHGDLGLEPSRPLRALERMILLQERTLDHRQVGRLHGVPRYATSFVGRSMSLRSVKGRLKRGRLLSLVGPGGVGKTRLAAESGTILRSAFPDDVWWVDLSGVGGEDVAVAVGRALALRESDADSPEEPVIARLRGARLLLIADGCEHVLPAVSRLVARLLAETQGARLLITSREPLGIGGEDVYRLPPLRMPPASRRGSRLQLRYSAVRLFAERAEASGVKVGAEAEAGDIDRLTDLLRELDGLPLAIELAAAKLRSLPLVDLADRLEGRIGLLVDGDRNAPGRHRTLEATIAWSFDLLSAAERAVLTRLAAFPGTFDAEAAEAVADGGRNKAASDLIILSRLVDKSLVAVDVEGSPRYRLLQTVRAFLLGRRSVGRALEAARRRHRSHFTALGEPLFRHMVDGQLSAWLLRARTDDHNFRTALAWSLDHGDADEALQLASALAAYWFRSSQLGSLGFLTRALELGGPDNRWRPRALVGRAFLARAGGSASAASAAEDAVAACADDEPELRGLALGALAQARLRLGRLDEVTEIVDRARALFTGSRHAEGMHFCNQLDGLLRFQRHDLDGAREALTRARDGYRALRGNLDAGWTLIQLAEVELAGGRLGEAHEAGTQAVEDFQLRGDPRGLATGFALLGRVLARQGDPRRARLLLEEALTLARRWEYAPEAAEAASALDAVSPRSP
jgi:predicted ATPase/DNA-binding SARP family transcriptional activator